MVTLDIKDYIDEANRQLNDTNNYKQLNFDPTELHNEKVKSEKKLLKIWKSLNFKNRKLSFKEEKQTSEFYLVPKIHKANNPGRPIIRL